MTHINDRNYKIAASLVKFIMGVLILMLGWFGNEIWSKQQINTDLIYSHEISIGSNSWRIAQLETVFIEYREALITTNNNLDTLNAGVREMIYELRAIRNGR